MEKHLLIDNPTVSNIVFYPRKTVIPNNLGPNVEILKFHIDEDVLIGGFFYKNDVNLPTILLFHGNGEVALDYRSIAPMFYKCEVNLAVVDFRGYGFSSGDPFYTSLISDAMPIFKAFTEWMNERDMLDSLFIQGRSLGSICAAEIGAHNPINLRGIIFESGFASAYNMMVSLFRVSSPDLTPESLNEYSNDTRVRKFTKPTLIIHGTIDWIIPLTEAKLLYKNLPDKIDKKLIVIEGAGHNNILSFQKEYFSPLSDFIKLNK
ncbi:MAG: alpha/beta fold hydrolase [Candidatus Lokiarchaeota archaeon]|nr:alpha/beta fold hydrolase [Candidatus Lokiarchaeota archaeon]